MGGKKEGRKLSKGKLKKIIDKERKRNEEPPETGSGSGFKPKKCGQQDIPKSLLRIMNLTQDQNKFKREKKVRSYSENVLTETDKKVIQSGANIYGYTDKLQREADDTCKLLKKEEAKIEKRDKLRPRKEDPKRVKKLDNLMKEYRDMRKDEKTKKKIIKNKLKKLKHVQVNSDSEEDRDTTGYDEVQFGDVVDAPLMLSKGAKVFINKLKEKRKPKHPGFG